MSRAARRKAADESLPFPAINGQLPETANAFSLSSLRSNLKNKDRFALWNRWNFFKKPSSNYLPNHVGLCYYPDFCSNRRKKGRRGLCNKGSAAF